MSLCHGRDCTNELEPSRGPVPRKFCSEKCRKSQYAATCVDCGAPTSGSEGRKETPRCNDCGRTAVIASGRRADMIRHAEREAFILASWATGASMATIASSVGSTPASIGVDIARMRARGVDVPYRQPWSRPKHARTAA